MEASFARPLDALKADAVQPIAWRKARTLHWRTNRPSTALVADGVAMPSAEQLQALTSTVESVQHNPSVGRVLIDALAGGKAGGAIDALLDGLPTDPAAATGIHQLAQQLAAGLDSGQGAFTAVAWSQSAFAIDPFGTSAQSLAPHHDAAPVV